MTLFTCLFWTMGWVPIIDSLLDSFVSLRVPWILGRTPDSQREEFILTSKLRLCPLRGHWGRFSRESSKSYARASLQTSSQWITAKRSAFGRVVTLEGYYPSKCKKVRKSFENWILHFFSVLTTKLVCISIRKNIESIPNIENKPVEVIEIDVIENQQETDLIITEPVQDDAKIAS